MVFPMTHKESLLIKYQDAYYNQQPIVSDAIYDALYDEVKKENPDSFVLKRVGALPPSSGDWPEAYHFIPMNSLNKAQTLEECYKWWPNYNVTMMEKLDGISISIQYLNGKFNRAITRGNGSIGSDISRNVSIMDGVLKNIREQKEVWIRGEIICKHSIFEKYFKNLDYKNARNAASGISTKHEGYEVCEHLTFIAYNVVGLPVKSKLDELTILSDMGFYVPTYRPLRLKDVENLYNKYIETTRDEIDYDIDGFVLCVDNIDQYESMGGTDKYPAGAIALKFPHESKVTTLRNIRWQVGNTGRITPVAEFDAVDLAGVTVKNANLHTSDRVRKMKLYKGCQILVSRRNDCIPFVEVNISLGICADDLPVYNPDNEHEYFMPPENCPVCEEKLIMNGEYLCCVNPDCPAQLAGSIRNWINKLNILEFGDAIINAVIESGMVKDIGDLYDLDPYKVSLLQNEGRYLGKNGEKAVNNLKEKKEITVENFIGSLGIPLWGRSMIRLLIGAGYNNLEKIYSLTISDLSKIKGIGDTKAEALIKGLEEKRNLIDKIISKGVKFKIRDGNLNGKSFCFTGFRSAELQEKIENAGGVIKSGVSKDLTYLVVLDINSTSGKTEKAKSYGVNIISLNEAKEMVD